MTTEAKGRRELTQHGVLPCAGGEGRGDDDLYCDWWAAPPAMIYCTACPAWELLSCERPPNPAAAAADILVNVHKTPTHKEGRGRHSMCIVQSDSLLGGNSDGGGGKMWVEDIFSSETYCREYWMINRGPGFLALERHFAGRGRGVSEEPNHDTTRKPGPLCIIQYSLGLLKYDEKLIRMEQCWGAEGHKEMSSI